MPDIRGETGKGNPLPAKCMQLAIQPTLVAWPRVTPSRQGKLCTEDHQHNELVLPGPFAGTASIHISRRRSAPVWLSPVHRPRRGKSRNTHRLGIDASVRNAAAATQHLVSHRIEARQCRESPRVRHQQKNCGTDLCRAP